MRTTSPSENRTFRPGSSSKRTTLVAFAAALSLLGASGAFAQFSEPYDDHAFDRPHDAPPAAAPASGPSADHRPYGPGEGFFQYCQDRFLDLCDLVRIKVGFGGFGASVRATTAFQIGAVYTDGVYFGIERRSVGVWREERFAGGIGPVYETDITTTFYGGNEFADPVAPWNAEYPNRGYVRTGHTWDDGRSRFLSFGGEVHFIIGADVAVYLDEAFDFLFGFVGVDFLEDDYRTLDRRNAGDGAF